MRGSWLLGAIALAPACANLSGLTEGAPADGGVDAGSDGTVVHSDAGSDAPGDGAGKGDAAADAEEGGGPIDAPTTGPAYVGRIGSATFSSATTTATSAVVPVSAPGSSQGQTILVSLLLTTVATPGGVSVADGAGNTYQAFGPSSDGAQDEVYLFSSVAANTLSGGAITVTFPATSEYLVTVDVFSGISAAGTGSSSNGVSAAFSTSVSVPSTPTLLVGAVGTESGNAAPVWDTGWTGLAPVPVAPDFLAPAYEIVLTTGSHTASGQAEGAGNWMTVVQGFQ
jgi:hypothetical protein